MVNRLIYQNDIEQEDTPCSVVVKRFSGYQLYTPIWKRMRQYTEQRCMKSVDQLWFLEHESVFTQGRTGKKECVLSPGHIPVIYTDRGGQVTYHGPGQIVVYLLLDIRRKKLNVRELVTKIERTIIRTLKHFDITAKSMKNAPGVYVDNSKIASLGLRIQRGCCFHGFALNVDMDLSPFQRIHPCGYSGLSVTHMKTFDKTIKIEKVRVLLEKFLFQEFLFEIPFFNDGGIG